MSDPRGSAAVIGAALRKRARPTRHGELRGHPRRARIATLADDPRRVSPLEQAEQGLAGLTEDERRKVLSGNAARVYNLDL